jgi:hypothetical protein
MKFRSNTGQWLPGLARQVGGHWLRGLNTQVKKILGLAMEPFPGGWDSLIQNGWAPVSRSKIGVMLPQLC